MSEVQVACVAAMLRRAVARIEGVFTSDDPDRLLRSAQRACRRAEVRLEQLRRNLEASE